MQYLIVYLAQSNQRIKDVLDQTGHVDDLNPEVRPSDLIAKITDVTGDEDLTVVIETPTEKGEIKSPLIRDLMVGVVTKYAVAYPIMDDGFLNFRDAIRGPT